MKLVVSDEQRDVLHRTAETMDRDTRSATFYRNKVPLATIEGRVEPSFVLPAGSCLVKRLLAGKPPSGGTGRGRGLDEDG